MSNLVEKEVNNLSYKLNKDTGREEGRDRNLVIIEEKKEETKEETKGKKETNIEEDIKETNIPDHQKPILKEEEEIKEIDTISISTTHTPNNSLYLYQ